MEHPSLLSKIRKERREEERKGSGLSRLIIILAWNEDLRSEWVLLVWSCCAGLDDFQKKFS